MAAGSTPLLGLGPRERCCEQVLVLDADSNKIDTAPASPPEEDLVTEAIVECDWTLQEYQSDEDVKLLSRGAISSEPSCPASPASSSCASRVTLPGLVWPPGRVAGRRLMEARARRCVICLLEREHTLVPRHLTAAGAQATGRAASPTSSRRGGSSSSSAGVVAGASGRQVAEHCFCTECWQQFLRHAVRRPAGSAGQRAAGAAPAERLLCPVCRQLLEVPDVWGTQLELPPTWHREPAPLSGPLPLPVVSVPGGASSAASFSTGAARRGLWSCSTSPASVSFWAWRRSSVGEAVAAGEDVELGRALTEETAVADAALEEETAATVCPSPALRCSWRCCGCPSACCTCYALCCARCVRRRPPPRILWPLVALIVVFIAASFVGLARLRSTAPRPAVPSMPPLSGPW